MVELKKKIETDLKDALKQKNELKLSVLRMFMAALHNKAIEKRAKAGSEEVSEEEFLAVLRSEAKKRKDSIQEFTRGGRRDLAEKEANELKILEAYLPAEISEVDLEKIVNETVREMGAVTKKDFGKVMGEVMKKTKGQASGDRISKLVARFLQAQN